MKASTQAGFLVIFDLVIIILTVVPVVGAQDDLSVMIQEAGDLRKPGNRRSAVESIRNRENFRRADANAAALALGLPLRIERADGHIHELADFVDGMPLYHTTLNENAAISTGADILRVSPYNSDGSGCSVGIWDGGSVRATHEELSGRVNVMDGGAAADHSTHVGGTIGAAGFASSAKGMMPAVTIDSYDWNSDFSEMTSRGASYPGEPDKLNISNHSYGYATGWAYLGGTPKWEWYGSITADASAIETDFGRYAVESRDLDSLAYSLPYYQSFWSAGNDRNDNPAAGDSVALVPGGSVVTYDAANHPPGDGVYRGGYDTISFSALAKNVITVGSVNDAVSGGVRSPASVNISTFSSFGPVDDGRIKPDLVANGYDLYSSLASSDTAYGRYSGTSMSSPNAAGTAGQILQWYGILFPGHALRASTLKALLIHTADDLGTAGPDYQYGWGLVNGVGAADLLQGYRSNPGTRGVIEDRVTDARSVVTFSFSWDGSSPIWATLCWTDPPGVSTTLSDSRVPRLVNNLDLRISAPDESTFQPWTMPFVGDWSSASCADAAVPGSNSTDNVEQVLISSPSLPGIYQARVSFAGTLSSGSQIFSLILSGVDPANIAPAPLLTDSLPLNTTGTALFTLTGDNFMPGASVRLLRNGEMPVQGDNIEFKGDTVETRINTDGLATGWWNMELTNPDGQRAVLYNVYVVPGPLWNEDFETNNIVAKGWSQVAIEGVSQWTLSTAKSVSPTQSMHSAGADTRSDTSLFSPPLSISPSAVGRQLSFWHDFTFESNDGGVLEFSIDGGGWFDVDSAGSGSSFVANGYNAVIGNGQGNPSNRNPLDGSPGWSSSSGGFIQTVVALTDDAKYAGHTLQVRWRLVTNTGTASTGWYVDDVVFFGAGNPPPPPGKGTMFYGR
jgi:hypothetical protein